MDLCYAKLFLGTKDPWPAEGARGATVSTLKNCESRTSTGTGVRSLLGQIWQIGGAATPPQNQPDWPSWAYLASRLHLHEENKQYHVEQQVHLTHIQQMFHQKCPEKCPGNFAKIWKPLTVTKHSFHSHLQCIWATGICGHVYCTCGGHECTDSTFRPHLSKLRV